MAGRAVGALQNGRGRSSVRAQLRTRLDWYQQVIRNEPIEGDPPPPPPPPVPAPNVRLMPEYHPGDEPITWRLQPGEVCAFPMTMPPEPYLISNVLTASSASDSPPALREGAINLTAGDLTGSTTGVAVTIDEYIAHTSRIKPGDRCFYNVRLTEGHPSSEGRFSATFPR